MPASQINKDHGVQEPDDARAFAGAVQKNGLMLPSGAVLQREVEVAVAKASDQPEVPAAPAALPDAEAADATHGMIKTFSARNRTGNVVTCTPGIPLPADVPSRGSILHVSGDCQPCAWFWRPGSCQNGIECGHCHLCPQGEIKARRKQKNTTMRSVGSGTPKVQTLDEEPHWIAGVSFPTDLLQEPQKVTLRGASAFSSESSALDATPGCDGNLMLPRKVSFCPSSTGVVPMRSEGWGGGGSDKSAASHSRMMAFLEEQRDFEADADAAEPHETKSAVGHNSAFSSESSAHDATPGCDGNPMQPRKVSCPSSTGMVPMRSEGWGGGGSDKSAASHSRMMAFLEEQRDFEADADAAEPHETKSAVGHKGSKPDGPAESVGSALHGTGQCRPCAWYWRPGSCQNGAECNHCHTCSEGEIKFRRKGKQVVLRSGSALPRSPSLVSDTRPQDAMRKACSLPDLRDQSLGRPSSGETESTTTASGSEDEVASSGDGSTGKIEKSAKKCSSEGKQPKAKTRLGSLVSVPPGLQAPPGTPSHGSTLHKVGNCWPCAQFWQASGCPNDSACGYCHLCPEGEMKLRKRSKKAMMRLGLCTPKVDSEAQRDTPNTISPFGF
eukprot:CAMPEP_0204097478 /NCGR_PEP_ID=MMETSP0360-20130528/192462_1 /ASSEMBLY_ACC=CAM_ASM_000342 /TAXON_ID=268821 /ORGANISM="Scrippsiella Hangoei, Strain SHTV-5" /LENGTH=611 /DNA_ID=CAMNT_0051046827 /DNA_START=55 /DNA_END=1890 /DNA_ORIENTATION=+